jgi:hypothetical protein
MQQKLYAASLWISGNPNSLRMISLSITAVLTLVAIFVPEARALATPEAPGGSD